VTVLALVGFACALQGSAMPDGRASGNVQRIFYSPGASWARHGFFLRLRRRRGLLHHSRADTLSLAGVELGWRSRSLLWSQVMVGRDDLEYLVDVGSAPTSAAIMR